MPPTISPHRSPPEPAVKVLVVATEAPARARLAARVRQALPSAEVHELSHVADLVYRVAGNGVDLVLLNTEPPQSLPVTPLLVQMLKGIRPALRIVCVAPSQPVSPPATDASLAEAVLGDWLRAVYGCGGTNLATSAPSARSA